MKIRWTLYTNANTEKNALTLLSRVRRCLEAPVARVSVQGDRYSGHMVTFEQPLAGERPRALYALLLQNERLGNSWVLSAVSAPARGWCNRSKIAGIQQLEWQEQVWPESVDPTQEGEGLHVVGEREEIIGG
ncbi:hypothetical protein [Motiliproteus sp. SC1-56]|uniref:hypothetical protein n=1 Tax=Motiliproteus sp. SC1-56 TaxID=2799565 RepID=UPI001A8F4DEA|nr:hypothetical protein [Motiliproteus sp. SC1-56]